MLSFTLSSAPCCRASLISMSICEGRFTFRVIFVMRLLRKPVSGKYFSLSNFTRRPTYRSALLSSIHTWSVGALYTPMSRQCSSLYSLTAVRNSSSASG